MTTGKGSDSQLVRIAAKYNEIQRSGQILSNRNAMDIIWHRVEQLAERIDLNEAPERMAKIRKMWDEFREADRKGAALEAAVIAREIDAEFEAAYHDYMAWQQMFDALQLHGKMVESEVKIMKDLRALMTAEDAYELVAKVMAVLLRVLQDDPKKLKEARYELSRLVGETNNTGSGRSGGESGIGSGSGGLDREQLLHPGDEERSYIEGEIAAGPVSQGLAQGDIPEG